MTGYPIDRRRVGMSNLVWLLAGVLALALVLGLTVSRPSGALADGDTNCDQADLQTALNAGQSTITFEPGCTIPLARSLTVGAGVNITINGNGLVLNGVNQSFDVIDFDDDESVPSTLSLNRVTIENGGFGISADGDGDTVNLTDSTVSDNSGLGIAVPSANVTQSSIIRNNSEDVGGFSIGNYTFTASILADDFGENCFNGTTIHDNGYNLSTDNTCGFSGTSKNNVALTSVTPGVGLNLVNSGALGDYGGQTQTIALGAGSIAIDYIPSADCPTDIDQRGVARPQGHGCDVGAYEAITVPYTVTHSTCPTQRDLQDDFDLGGAVDGNFLTINVTPENCPIALTSPLELGSGVNVTVNGHGLTLDGQGQNDVIDIDAASAASTLSVNQITVENGLNGIYSNSTATINVTASTVSGNRFIGVDGYAVHITNSTIASNSDAGIFPFGLATVTDSTITDNAAGIESGLFDDPTVTVTASILDDNTTNCDLPNEPAIVDGGHNIAASADGNDDSCGFAASTKGSENVTSAALNLANNGEAKDFGGPTGTVALEFGSVAIDFVPTADCLIGADQRGVSRPQGAGCDAGAYEAPYFSLTADPPSANGSNGWYTKSIGLTFSYSGLEASANIECTNVDNKAFGTVILADITSDNQSANNVTSTLAVDGTYHCDVNMPQGVGLGVSTTSTSTFDYKLDATEPNVKCSPPDRTAWYNSNQTVNCTASDAISKLADTDLASFSLTTTYASNGVDANASTGTQQVCDNAGNCFTAGPYSFKIDRQPPTVRISASLANSSSYTFGDWANQNVTVTIAGDDAFGSGVKSVSYTINGGTTTTVAGGSASPTLSDQGQLTITYYATDNVGNTSSTSQPVEVDIDTVKPSLHCSPPDQSVWHDSNQTVSCTASDATSGLVDAGLKSFSLTTTVADGTADSDAETLSQQVCDNAGNCDTKGPYSFKIDLQDPTAQAGSVVADGGSYTPGSWTNQDVTVTITGEDGSGSGVKSVSYSINNGTPTNVSGGSATLQLTDQGRFTINYTATDNAGNASSTESITVDIDHGQPSITITSPKGQSYALKATLKAAYTCALGSGISPVTTCQGTVTLPDKSSQTIENGDTLPTNELGTYAFVMNATNAAGNSETKTVTYTVSYATPALPGNTATVKQGYYAVIRFAPEDANGHDYASRTLKVASVELDGDGQTIAFAHAFQFGTFSGTKGYQLTINTRNLARGTWKLLITIGGDTGVVYQVTFAVE